MSEVGLEGVGRRPAKEGATRPLDPPPLDPRVVVAPPSRLQTALSRFSSTKSVEKPWSG
jgi:hypothetical protein